MDILHYTIPTIPFIVILLFIYIIHHYSNKKLSNNLPPSPPSLPFIGHLHLLKSPRNLSIHSLSQLYGPVVALRLGSRNAIILSSPAAVEEALIKNDTIFSNHPVIKAGHILGYNNTTMFFSPYNPHWRNLRRLTSLQLLSTSRINLLTSIRTEEFLSLIRRMVKDSSSGKIDIQARFFEMTYNLMSKMVVGKRYYGECLDVEVEVANQFRDIMKEEIQLMFSFNPRDFFPALGWLDLLGVERKMERLLPRVDRFLTDIVEEARRKRRNDPANGNEEAEKETKEEEKSLVDVMLSMQDTDPETFTDEVIKGHIKVSILYLKTLRNFSTLPENTTKY
ncbi:cytochrome P450 81E8-like [Dioscorea cayenensis subsp. rotundata]|uniref:Cytochrome P450 81E8-like n=1 Tax=Dioscorea cayennensis subsp. rotundata TaxID=55577 RepID=A0AB40AKL2_DIOCR|nr:cytochrome P450 81E8-like [Dioscorea cayenensis subsp. rotundata]